MKRNILIRFKENGWVDPAEECSEDDLMKCALQKIELIPSHFQILVNILKDTVGMQDIVKLLETHNL